MSFPTRGYKDLYDDCPEIPGNTCPHIDKAQQYLEELRDHNEALRDVGKYWRRWKENELFYSLCYSSSLLVKQN